MPSESEDGSYELRQYFTLRPPDGRPPVTVDSTTASRLKTGGIDVEAAYSGAGGVAQNGKQPDTPAPASEGDEYVYSAANGAYVSADPILSTATADQRPAHTGTLLGSESRAHESGAIVPAPSHSNLSSSSSASSFPSSFSSAPYTSPSAQIAPRGTAPAEQAGIPTDIPPELAKAAASAEAPSSSVAAPASAPSATTAHAKDQEYVLSMGGDSAKRAPAAVAGVGGLVANNRAQGFGIKKPEDDLSSGGKGGKGDAVSREGKEIEEILPPCVPGRKIYTSATLERIPLPKGCHVVMITAWGAGGGAGFSPPSGNEEYGWMIRQLNGAGGGGAFVSASGDVDARKYDLVVAVGAPGGNANQAAAGNGGFPGGADGGFSSTAAGGGGGGFTGVFLVPKGDGGKPMLHQHALAVAAGGGGGAGRGAGGGGGGIEKGEGDSRGASGKSGGTAGGNAKSGAVLAGGAGGSGLAFPNCQMRTTRNGKSYCGVYEGEGGYTEVPEDSGSAGGGGGGGGYYGGAGGAGAANGGQSEPGGGGSSHAGIQMLLSSPAQGATPGFNLHPNRGGAGSPGQAGRLEIEWY